MTRRESMTRRAFSGAVAAAAVSTVLDIGWVTIAHLGTNLAGRTYANHHMAVIARDVVPGMQVFDWHHDEPPSLDQLHGVISHARMIDDEYQVKVRWLTGKRPTEKSWLSIHGTMNVNGGALDGSTGFTLLKVDHLEPSSAGSCFQRATAI